MFLFFSNTLADHFLIRQGIIKACAIPKIVVSNVKLAQIVKLSAKIMTVLLTERQNL